MSCTSRARLLRLPCPPAAAQVLPRQAAGQGVARCGRRQILPSAKTGRPGVDSAERPWPWALGQGPPCSQGPARDGPRGGAACGSAGSVGQPGRRGGRGRGGRGEEPAESGGALPPESRLDEEAGGSGEGASAPPPRARTQALLAPRALRHSRCTGLGIDR